MTGFEKVAGLEKVAGFVEIESVQDVENEGPTCGWLKLLDDGITGLTGVELLCMTGAEELG
jgi:hypothetical protein